LARKITKKDEIIYICEKCNNEMFKFSVREKGLFTADDPFMFKKYLNKENPNEPTEPYYQCQFCGTIHKGYYTNGGRNIDFRPLIWK